MVALSLNVSAPGSGGTSAPSAPAWPPPNALHLHPDTVTTAGPDSDVQSITFASGHTMAKTGSGSIVKSASGFTFSGSAHFSLALPVAKTYDQASMFGRLTFSDTGWQYPINIEATGVNVMYASVGASSVNVLSDLGNETISYSQNAAHPIPLNASGVIGVEASTTPIYGARHLIWQNGQIVGVGNVAEAVSPTHWTIGRAMKGTIHEGVVFFHEQGTGGEMYAPGQSGQWICDQLAGA